MAKLEELTRGATVKGILPDALITVVDVQWHGDMAITLTYRDAAGRLGNEILYRDRKLSGKPHEVTAAGLARTFQNIRLFPNMTALENVLVGRHCRTKEGLFSAIGHGRRFHTEERESRERGRELLALVGSEIQRGRQRVEILIFLRLGLGNFVAGFGMTQF